MRTRQVGSLIVMAGFLAFTTATSKPKKGSGTEQDAAASSATAPLQPAAPLDIDPAAISAKLGCDSKPANVGCGLLREFDLASAFVDLPLANAVWFGESHAIGGLADGKKELFFFQASGSSAGFVGSARTLVPENTKEAQDAAKLLFATKSGAGLPGSAAAEFMRNSVPFGGRKPIVRTRGKSQVLAGTPTQVYIRLRGERLIIVEHTGNFLSHESAKGPGSALAWVSELFPMR
jgi:hypothetical protein